jgi:hypothetical protein
MNRYTASIRLEHDLECAPLIRLAGKRPMDRGWTTGPYDDPDRWRDDLLDWTGNVGVVCGHGLVVIDCDVYKPDGARSFAQLEAHGLPATREAETGSGGRHLFYRVSGPVPSRPLVGYPGIDVKGDGGQVVVAPSIHPDSGRPYRWVNDLPVANVPGWLEALVAGPAGNTGGKVPAMAGTSSAWRGSDVIFPLF